MFFFFSKFIFLFLRPSNFIVLLLLGGTILRMRGRMRLGGTLSFMSLVLLVLCGWGGVSFLGLSPLENRFPQIHELDKAPTGIIVLGGAIKAELSSARGSIEMDEGSERLIAGAELARQFPDARVLFTGGSGVFIGDDTPEAVFAKKLLLQLGVEPSRLEIESASRNTRENGIFSKSMVNPKPGETWLLVTSAWHIPRSMGVFRKAGWPGLVAYPVDFRTSPRDTILGGYYASDGLTLTDIAAKEWIGLVAYYIAGYTDALFPGPGDLQP
ncbi:hypothetical protein HDIA_1792 [Hartmannibacter diazotrophicus]|uniref:DUF218 domain-containing protein n=1 Tax=Hartmannibacter diazotrophicus TaxID=1482074 RepID=A0A2C9D532_9HYPH|nr:YdcF family protein [Hartmannibacter diazotrophicus]SON55333.1 hypothetical protein HDIA_1792 [Hartmannibacter diazotrophicus]